MKYNNAVLTITNMSTPDPHVTFANRVYHMISRMIVNIVDKIANRNLRSTPLGIEWKCGLPQNSSDSEIGVRNP